MQLIYPLRPSSITATPSEQKREEGANDQRTFQTCALSSPSTPFVSTVHVISTINSLEFSGFLLQVNSPLTIEPVPKASISIHSEGSGRERTFNDDERFPKEEHGLFPMRRRPLRSRGEEDLST